MSNSKPITKDYLLTQLKAFKASILDASYASKGEGGGTVEGTGIGDAKIDAIFATEYM